MIYLPSIIPVIDITTATIPNQLKFIGVPWRLTIVALFPTKVEILVLLEKVLTAVNH